MKGFGSDNHSGVHPQLLKSLQHANVDHAPSYGTDDFSVAAADAFSEIFERSIKPFFVFNGTSANVLAFRCMLKPWQAVLCSDFAHINVDECGAPEYLSGAKLYPLPARDGKLTIDVLKSALIRRGDQHYSQAKVVSLTQPTEFGTCYSVEEIRDICNWAHAQNLFVHVDGARIANAVVSCGSSFKEMFTDTGVDAVSFGGTKNGLMFGEAVLFLNPQMSATWNADAIYARKQMGQLPSKTRFIAAAFVEYLRSGLWQQIATDVLAKAQKLATLARDIPGVQVTQQVQSNAVFARIPQPWVKPLREKFFFYVWDEKTFECRWMISFDTEESEINGFCEMMQSLAKL